MLPCQPTRLLVEWQDRQASFCCVTVPGEFFPNRPIGSLDFWACLPPGPWQLSHCSCANGAFGSPFTPCFVLNSTCTFASSSSWQRRQVSAPNSEYAVAGTSGGAGAAGTASAAGEGASAFAAGVSAAAGASAFAA